MVERDVTIITKSLAGDKIEIKNEDIVTVLRVKTVAGQPAYVSKEEPFVTSTNVRVSCDSANCEKINGAPKITHAWNLEKAGEDADEVPDGMFRTLGLKLFDSTELLFCGVPCLLDYLEGFKPLRSPREKRLVDKVFCIQDATGFSTEEDKQSNFEGW